MTKGKDLENDYFIREESTQKHVLEEQHRRERENRHAEELKALHYMKCPKCGHDLKSVRLTYIDVDQCGSCGVLVLRPEDVDRFIAEEKSVLKPFLDFFKP